MLKDKPPPRWVYSFPFFHPTEKKLPKLYSPLLPPPDRVLKNKHAPRLSGWAGRWRPYAPQGLCFCDFLSIRNGFNEFHMLQNSEHIIILTKCVHHDQISTLKEQKQGLISQPFCGTSKHNSYYVSNR